METQNLLPEHKEHKTRINFTKTKRSQWGDYRRYGH